MGLIASDIIERAMRLCLVLDSVETPTTLQYADGVKALNSMLRHEFADKTSSWKIIREDHTFATGVQSQVIGPSGDIVADARAVRHVWRVLNGQTQYKLTQKNEEEFFQTDVNGQPVNWYDERNADGTITLYLWPTPKPAYTVRVSMAIRMNEITEETDTILIPPDAEDAVTFLLASRLRGEYGVPVESVPDVEAKATMYRDQFKMRNRANSYIKLRG